MEDARGQPKGVQWWGNEGNPTIFHGEWHRNFDDMLLIFDMLLLGIVSVRLERRPKTTPEAPESEHYWEGRDRVNRVVRLFNYAFSRCERKEQHSQKLHWVEEYDI